MQELHRGIPDGRSIDANGTDDPSALGADRLKFLIAPRERVFYSRSMHAGTGALPVARDAAWNTGLAERARLRLDCGSRNRRDRAAAS